MESIQSCSHFIHIAISVIPGTHFHLSQVKHLRVKCLAQDTTSKQCPNIKRRKTLYFFKNPAPYSSKTKTRPVLLHFKCTFSHWKLPYETKHIVVTEWTRPSTLTAARRLRFWIKGVGVSGESLCTPSPRPAPLSGDTYINHCEMTGYVDLMTESLLLMYDHLPLQTFSPGRMPYTGIYRTSAHLSTIGQFQDSRLEADDVYPTPYQCCYGWPEVTQG